MRSFRTKILAALVLWGLAAAQEMDSDGFHVRDTIKAGDISTSQESDYNYWSGKAALELQKQLSKKRNTRRAKNVIMFLGDGMSIPTVTAARFYGAEAENLKVGEKEFLSFEEFPYTGLSRTYCTDSQVADSACSATAYLGGAKGNKGTIGVTGNVRRGDCAASLRPSNRVQSIAAAAQRAGKATGVVTNTRITHASPAGTYAHVADRDWESDYEIQKDGKNSSECDDIAKQLILREPGKNFNVIMGGGRRSFIPKIELDPAEKTTGYRLDNVNLINEWKRDKISKKKKFAYVTTRDELRRLVEMPTHLLGLFAYDHMDDEVAGNPLQPSLEEMTAVAINVLKQNKKGYFLFVEGGRIDMAHHKNKAQVSLHETLAFSRAIAKATEMTNETDTLIVVTSDHAHTMSFSGYARRSETILGFGGFGKDDLPYAVLSYANGPGYGVGSGGRKDLRKDDMNLKVNFRPPGHPEGKRTFAHSTGQASFFSRRALEASEARIPTQRHLLDGDAVVLSSADSRILLPSSCCLSGLSTGEINYVFPSGVPKKSETHGGDDVGVFARGPFSHLFTGSYEQNYIPHAMAYAANISLGFEPEQTWE